MSEPDPTWWQEEALSRERWGDLAKDALESIVTARSRGRLPQALLLIGPQGLGRELAAVEAAALMTCPEEQGPWCECSSCRRARAGTHPDVAAVLPTGAASVIKIEQIRKIVEDAPGRPYESGRRIWIVDGVESGSLGKEAANAFLKTLEEPPDHVRFMLLGERPEAILSTIRSRCQRLTLPGPVAVAARLGERLAVPELARSVLAGGKPSDARPIDTGPVEEALIEALGGEVLPLLRLATVLADDPGGFEIVAAAALELTCGEGAEAQAASGAWVDSEAWGQDLVRLAAALLQASARTRALNLNRGRQLLACLLRWFRLTCRPGGAAATATG